jgi:hypothetical protein
MIASALVLSLLLQETAEPPPPARRRVVQSSVRIIIEEAPKGDYDHDYYEQPQPSQYKTGNARLGSEVWYRTVCRPQENDHDPIVFTPPETPLPLTISGVLGSPTISIGDGGATLIDGKPRRDPQPGTKSQKTSLFSGSSSDSSATDSDSPFLYGVDFDYVLAPDVTTWGALRWMPEETSFHFYARALFGSMDIFEVSTDIQLFSVGPRLSVPLARWGGAQLDATLSAGPGFLHTGIGDAVGFDGGAGLRFGFTFSRSVSLIAEIEANLFLSDSVAAFGPVLNLGFNLSW